MKILVVGGAGYIGSHTARVLRRAGLEVLIYDNLSTGFDFLAKGFEMVVGDVHDSEKLLEAVKRSDAVMHFAANHYVGESVVNPRKYYRNNVEGGLSLLNAIVDSGKKNFLVIFSSTCCGLRLSRQNAHHRGLSPRPRSTLTASPKFFSNRRCSLMTRPTESVTPACATSTRRERTRAERLANATSRSRTSFRWLCAPPPALVPNCKSTAPTIPRRTAPAFVITRMSSIWPRRT